MLFIGAYRDNEVSPSHPLMGMLAQMVREGADVESIAPGPLQESDVAELVGDTVRKAPGHLRLALTCHAKTGGNAFFLNRFLESLAERKLVYFDLQDQRWTWDLKAITAEAITDNVVDLLQAENVLVPSWGAKLLAP